MASLWYVILYWIHCGRCDKKNNYEMWVPHRKKKSRLIPRHSRKGLLGAHIEFSCTRVPRSRWQLEVQNCWALRHGQAFLSASFKQKPVHVYTEISLRPGWAATSMSLSSISSRVKFISMMAGEKNHHPSIHVKLHELLHLMRVWMELSDNWQMAKILTDNWQIA